MQYDWVNFLEIFHPTCYCLEPLPKPRVACSPQLTLATGSETHSLQQSHVHDQKNVTQQDIKSQSRGKRPVPLPRRLSSISSPKQSPSSPSPSPNVPKTPQQQSPTHFFSPVKTHSAKKSSVSSTSSASSRLSGSEFPTPTANFKSYRRAPSTSSESTNTESRECAVPRHISSAEQVQKRNTRVTPRHKQPAPLPHNTTSKSKSVTRLSFDGAGRADSGLGHSSVSSADSVNMDQVNPSSTVSPVRIMVKQQNQPRKSWLWLVDTNQYSPLIGCWSLFRISVIPILVIEDILTILSWFY